MSCDVVRAEIDAQCDAAAPTRAHADSAGRARDHDGEREHRTERAATGELRGKIAYFSPEQAAGEPLDRRADVFALGAVAFEVLAGRRLFSAPDALQILAQVSGAPIPQLHELDEAIPYAVSAAVARALARPLDERWPTAGAFAVALRGAAEELGPRASPREIAAWVREAGGAPLAEMRGQIERALAGGEDAARALADEPPRSSEHGAASQPETATLLGVSSEPRAREGMRRGESEPARAPGRGRAIAGVLGGVVLVLVLVWAVRGWRAGAVEPAAGTNGPPAASGASATARPVEIAAGVRAVASAPSSAASPASAAEMSSVTRPALLGAARVVAAPAPSAAVPSVAVAGALASAAPAARAAAPTAPTAPVASPAKVAPKGAILGDDAFNRDLGKMTK